ncbi:hypothetical protein [Cysteiniphilum sp. 6C5]|uniref:hypothetical protein n=1 Tax=unclassified Cysteiniphilum TaxID=2610889 RepID=UPI003F866AC5
MKKFKYYFFGIMDAKDKRAFWRYVMVFFLGSIFAVLGIGAVIPFINVLIQPEKVMSYQVFNGWSYNHIIIVLTVMLIIAFAVKNLLVLWLLNYQSFFKDCQRARFIPELEDARSNYWLNAIFLSNPNERDTFLKMTNDADVMTRPVWALMNDLPMLSVDLRDLEC